MSYGRRTADRRRRVLYTTQQADATAGTAVSRREAQRLREARRPTARYGERVHRRLQGRWFSLVPVRRRTLLTVASGLIFLAVMLCCLHYLAVAWPAVANQPDIARPLRLDRADSFGNWVTSVMLAATAGASLLIYQLRRYRIDDYQGHYRLWRLMLIAAVLANINHLTSLVDWLGAILDATVGRRVALSGEQWVDILLTLGGAVLAVRLMVEIRHCRAALAAMLITCVFLAVAVAARWDVFATNTLWRWLAVTTAPLLACTTLLIALGIYLRVLYRDVRQIEDMHSLKQRLLMLRPQWFQHPRHLWGRPKAELSRDRNVSTDPAPEKTPKTEPAVADASAAESEPTLGAVEAKAKRRWWGRGKSKRDGGEDDSELDREKSDAETSAEPAKKKRRRFSLRRSASNAETAGMKNDPADETRSPDSGFASDDASDGNAAEEVAAGRKRRFGFGWRRDKSAKTPGGPTADHDAEPAEHVAEAPDRDAGNRSAKSAPAATAPARAATQDQDASDTSWDEADPDDIDWSSMSKAERRRVRKQLKRQDRAA